MTTNTRQFHEFGYTQLAGLSDDAVKAQYEAAFNADPVNGFRFGHHIKNRAFAGEFFKKAAPLAPASAFADMQSYGYVLQRNALYEIKDDGEFEKALRLQITEGINGYIAEAKSKGEMKRVEELQEFKVDDIIKQQEYAKHRKDYQAEQQLYPWLKDVLVAAAAASPQAAETYRPLWENLPFKAEIESAMSGRGTAKWTARAMHGDKLDEAQAAAAR